VPLTYLSAIPLLPPIVIFSLWGLSLGLPYGQTVTLRQMG